MTTEHEWFEQWKQVPPVTPWREFKLALQRESIKRIESLGGTIMPLANHSKIPLKGTHGVDDPGITSEEALKQYVLGRNLAVRVGCERYLFNRRYVIVDLEGRYGSHKVFWEGDVVPLWMKVISEKTLSVSTPSGGYHCYCDLIDYSFKDIAHLVKELQKKMKNWQESLPVVSTYALIPYSKVRVPALENKSHLYFWNEINDPIDFSLFVDMIP